MSDLIRLRTNLTQKKFGNDQPGYGSSGLPYIQTSIPPTPYLLSSRGPGFPLFTPGTTGNLDYPIRGGAIEFQIGQQTYTLSSQIDKTRIRRFFEDKQRGTAFIQKQVGLQLTNPKIETGNSLFGLGQGFPVPGLLENTRIYNRGVNTLEQVGVQGSGAHAVRHGLVPFNLFQKDYYAIVNAQNVNNEKATNRLLNLSALKMTVGVSPVVNPQNVLDIATVNNLGISLNRNLLFQYLGGPGSTYGIGTTTIKRAVDTTQLGVTVKRFASRNAMTYNLLKQQKTQLGNPNPEIQDYRKFLPPSTFWDKRQSVDYRFFVNKQDKINKLYPFVFRNSSAPWEIDRESTDDLIKFVFEAVSNDDTQFSTAIFFRALLTSGITDNNTATLSPFKYLGRGENFYTYQGFDRSISFSFKVAAHSEEEMRPIYNRVNTLVSQVYPDYSAGGIMRAPIVRITIGDYLYRMPGFLESVNVTTDFNAAWEVNSENDESGRIGQLPQAMDITISFKPILNELPRRARFDSKLASSNINLNTERDLGFVTEDYQIETNVPEIMANNGKIIQTSEESQLSVVRSASPGEVARERERLLEEERVAFEQATSGVDISGIENEQSDPLEFDRLFAEESVPTLSDLTGQTTAF